MRFFVMLLMQWVNPDIHLPKIKKASQYCEAFFIVYKKRPPTDVLETFYDIITRAY